MGTILEPTVIDSSEQQIDLLLRQMTLKEKVGLLSGKDAWRTMPVERLGIPSITMTDGPNGVRADKSDFGRPAGPTTAFPTGSAMGATWNPEILARATKAMAEESLAMSCDILLGPCVNMVRTPLGGRNFESFGEDPYLSGQLATAWIQGLQGAGVGASLKHFAVNNQEIERLRTSSEVDERTLREIYLTAFEIAVKNGHPWTVMCSYNRINGVYASQNHHLLNEILRDEWGFDGLVVSDWGANHTTIESVSGGLDMEMPGPAKYYGKLLSEAVYHWQIEEEAIDRAVRRILRLILLTGAGTSSRPTGSVNTPEHQEIARTLAEDAITLLKNDHDLLPLDLSKVHTIAVIGPNAVEMITGGGGSSYVHPPYVVTPLDGIKERLGGQVRIEYEQGCVNYVIPPVVRKEWLAMPDGNGSGMQGEYYPNTELSGQPVFVRSEAVPDFWWFSTSPSDDIPVEHFSARWTAILTVPETDYYIFQLSHSGKIRMLLDDHVVFESTAKNLDKFEEAANFNFQTLELQAGRPYRLVMEFAKYPGQEFAHTRLGMLPAPSAKDDERFKQAVGLARRSDVAILVAGEPLNYETEGIDRQTIELPGRQDDLIRAVAEANPNTVVVLNVGAPVAMSWVDRVAAVLVGWFPGQEGGHAIARVLAGDVNPSGKLPVTFPRRLEDNPAFENQAYPEERKVLYGEGIYIGYRYYDHRGIEPLFPFGHGLSYTTFEYSDLAMPEKVRSGDEFQVSLRVTNTGKRAGQEIVQLYVGYPHTTQPRPIKELKGFEKILLQPGESQVLTFTLGPRSLSYYDCVKKSWVVEPGPYEILAGSSSRDIRLRGSFKV